MKQITILLLFVLITVRVSAAEVNAEFGGLDAYALAKGMDVPTDCSISWEDSATKKTYCFSNAGAKSSWAADPRGNLIRAETGYRAALMKSQAMAQVNAQMKQAQQQMNQAQGALNTQTQIQGNTQQINQAKDAMNAAQGKLNAGQVQLQQAGQVPAGAAVVK